MWLKNSFGDFDFWIVDQWLFLRLKKKSAIDKVWSFKTKVENYWAFGWSWMNATMEVAQSSREHVVCWTYEWWKNVEKGGNFIFVGWGCKLSLLCAPCLIAMKGGHVCLVVKLCFTKWDYGKWEPWNMKFSKIRNLLLMLFLFIMCCHLCIGGLKMERGIMKIKKQVSYNKLLVEIWS